MPVTEAPDWVREALARSAEEARSFVLTGTLFTWRPGRFARDWANGQLRVLNPMGVLATGAGVLAVARLVLSWLLGRGGGGREDLLGSVRDALAPFAHYVVLGALCHLALRTLGSRRRLRDSLAMSLFAGGGPGVLSPLVVYAVGAALWAGTGRGDVIHNGLIGSLPGDAATALRDIADAGYALFLLTLLASLRTLHDAPWWKATAAVAFAVVCVGLTFGAWPVDVPFGTRVLIRFHPLRSSIWVD
jgi:hypothetical protein